MAALEDVSPARATHATTAAAASPAKRDDSADRDASIGPTPEQKGARERSADPLKRDDVMAKQEPGAPPEHSAYALLALMESVQKAAQASAEERGRTSESYKAWKAEAKVREADTRPAKKRKPTHTVRKEEITVLTDEIAQLEKRLAFLRGQSVAPSPSLASQKVEEEDPEHPQIPNGLLREAIHEQQLSLACARSMVSQFFASDFALPAHCYIHLPSTSKGRLRMLQAVRPQQLRVARRYVLERSRHLNLRKPHTSNEQFISESGDACSLRFSLTQFPGSLAVRDVFDAATFFTYNLEMSFTDGAGRVTIREDDEDLGDLTMSQHRIATTVRDELLVETNLAIFTHFDEDEDYGIVTSTFVDRDDLYPYRTRDRIRQDVTAILMVTREDDTIVMRRLGHVRVHHNDNFDIGDTLMQNLSESVSNWGDALVKHVRQRFGIDP